jgi:very-short-patch-repair endonuclease
MKRLSQEDYIRDCQSIHENKYDYSLVDYKNTRSKIRIICKQHGVFLQLSKSHKQGQGCPSCAGRNQLLSDYIEKCGKMHNNKYDYSLVFDLKKKSNIRIVDINTNLIFNQITEHHENGHNPTKIEKDSLIKRFKTIHNNKYSYLISTDIVTPTDKIKLVDNISGDEFIYRVDRHLLGMSPNKLTLNRFKLKSSERHNNKYDYSLIKEISSSKDIVNIICPEHGIFKQTVNNHMNSGDRCADCAGIRRWNTNMLVSEFNKIHFGIYDYSLVTYESTDKKVKIICKKHGIFNQGIHHHLSGQGCKSCSSNSIGEEYIKLYLEKMEIKYIHQHGFDTCKYINKLSFDFYLPNYNTCIEFDGIQHFKPVKDFGGERGFIVGQKRDECKNKWCMDNNVNLIRIKYDQISKISEILNSEISHINKILNQ